MLSHKKCGIGCCLQQHHKGLVSVGLEQEGGLARECVCVHVCACAAPPSSATRPMSGDKAAL